MKILVDIGNSRCKSAVQDEQGLRALEPFAWHDVFLHEVLERVWLKQLDGRVPTSVHVSNVAGERLLPNLNAWCCSHWGLQPIAATSQPSFGRLQNGYQDPSTFGVDRWMAMIGATERHSGALCVIDSGTATTIDVVDASGRHIGGAILPGIYTMRRSLGKYTSALFAADGEISPFSDNTASGIAGGTGYASVGAIDRLIAEARKVVGPVRAIVTGGESKILVDLLEEEVERCPMLVLEGVSAVARSLSLSVRDAESKCPEVVAR